MKKIIILIFLTTIFHTSSSQNSSKLDEKYGFRNLKFETLIDSIKNLKLSDSIDENLKVYNLINEDLNVFDLKVQEILYTFYKNKLYRVTIISKDVNNNWGFLNLLQKKYGLGKCIICPEKFVSLGIETDYGIYQWNGINTKLDYVYKDTQILNEDGSTLEPGAMIEIISKKIMKQQEKDVENKLKKSKEF